MWSDGLPDTLIGEWGLRAIDVRYPTTGTMNDIAVITTLTGDVVLRGHRTPDRRQVEFEHEVMRYARSRGVPVPKPIETRGGGLIVERGGRLYSLFEAADGRQVDREHLDAPLAEAMGSALASLHAELRTFPTATAPKAKRNYDYRVALQRIERLLLRLDALAASVEQDDWARQRLRSRAEWLRDRPGPSAPVLADEQLVHGDYQDSNLFFRGGEVSSVIDWDKAEVRPPAEEVVRALHLSLSLDPTRCRAFLDGYRSVTKLEPSSLDIAARVYGDGRACDLWLFETIYLNGDDRPRRFLTPGRFIPFPDQWDSVRHLVQ